MRNWWRHFLGQHDHSREMAEMRVRMDALFANQSIIIQLLAEAHPEAYERRAPSSMHDPMGRQSLHDAFSEVTVQWHQIRRRFS